MVAPLCFSSTSIQKIKIDCSRVKLRERYRLLIYTLVCATKGVFYVKENKVGRLFLSFCCLINERGRERFRGAACLLALVVILAVLPTDTRGQQLSVIEQEQQFEDEDAISVLQDTEWLRPPVEPGINADWGGWVTTSFYRFDDFDHYDRIDDLIEGANTVDFRFWTKVFVGERNSVYFRLKHRVNMTNWGSGAAGRGTTDHDGPHVDMLYASLKFPRSTVTRFGRQYFKLGRGLVLGTVLDGINVQKRFKKTAIGLILAKTRFVIDGSKRLSPRPTRCRALSSSPEPICFRT